ncbi:hypothetical protein PF010_g3420 [Phytophthora fragariae]|uniref:Uncharacterized protein n=1 Tax=Phytophthora fragariae TaxID=53985 RepID=A0A6A3M4E9_9STRA|nr:hypothetical protein PF011_g3077 [Phytophthora fragariae]KAE9131775.1 hypothetical protein PF010_g3420 [Phytophthora fragariae]KAE9249878.1 hypothetical protein PF004_g3199 [Phytophthora fragariae]
MSEPLLTTHGLRKLSLDSADSAAAVRLQVLGVYRYLADPSLKERLGQPFEAERDVLDVLLSDGRHKMKAVLAPDCHPLVWTRELAARSIIRVTKFKVFSEDPVDDKQKLRVVVLMEVAVTSHNDDGVPDKVLARSYGAQRNDDQLQFLSTRHPREVELLPLVGERVYYLPLRSDHYTLDWACSFTGGVPDEDSPLDDLESDWAGRYGVSESSDGEETAANSVVAWNINPEFCADLFTPECKKIHAILEVLDQIKKSNESGATRKAHPPMLGAIRVKSKVMNMGDPDIANPFPFAFNVVFVDSTGVFEVAFFGSMCAKYYLSLREGDLIQLRGYSTVNPHDLQYTMTTSPLLYYEHDSSGSALHVPEKYWALLQMTKVAPLLLEVSDDIAQRSTGSHLPRPSWLECSFVNTLSTLYWGQKAINDLEIMYFDFIGVLSNVGRICRGRKRRLGEEDSPQITEYRWVKMIDSSSSHELVIKISECSQPAVFRSLEAGNTLMITKLQWVMLPGASPADKRIQYATTSVFSVLRMNEAVLPFHSIEECSLNVYFANNIKKNAVYDSRKELGESKLTAHIEKKYRPRNCLPSDFEEFKEAFNLKVCSFKELSLLARDMEAYEQRHVGFIGKVKAIRNDAQPAKDRRPSVLLELSDSNDKERFLVVVVSINPLYQRPAVKGGIKRITPPEALPLIRLLPATITDNMLEDAGPPRPELSLGFITKCLVNSNRDFFFSLQLYRDGIDHVTWEVDAILDMP